MILNSINGRYFASFLPNSADVEANYLIYPAELSAREMITRLVVLGSGDSLQSRVPIVMYFAN